MKAQPNTKQPRIHVRIDADLLAKAHQVARLSNQTLSDVVRTLIEAYTAR